MATDLEKRERQKAYYLANRDRIIARVCERAREKAPEIKAYKQAWQAKNAERIAAKKRVYQAEHRDDISAYNKARYASRSNAVKATVKAYRDANPEKVRAVVRAWCVANRERLRAAKRAWALENPACSRASSNARRARERGARIGTIDFKSVLNASGGVCGICGEAIADAPFHFDHIIPLARGGSHTTDNIQVAHARCNLSKGARVA